MREAIMALIHSTNPGNLNFKRLSQPGNIGKPKSRKNTA